MNSTSRIQAFVAIALILVPAATSALEVDIMVDLEWSTTGDANPDLAYSFNSSHRLEITECFLHQCAYQVIFNTAIYKNSSFWGVKDVCNRFGVAGLSNVFTCSNSYSQACPSAEGRWFAVSEAEIGLTIYKATAGPVIANCPPTGGCLPFKMATSMLPLSETSTYLERVPAKSSNRMAYTLNRTKVRGNGKFLMDEWAVSAPAGGNTASGPNSSSEKFGRAVGAQLGHLTSGPFLFIQQPVHERNDRWVPLPEIHLSETALTSDRVGHGEVVAVRAEIFENPRIDDLQVLYASSPVDEAWLEQLLRQRIALQFATSEEHPTVAYLVLRIGKQLEVLGSRSVLPKCCPCDGICIPD